jgi:hypothetical protein
MPDPEGIGSPLITILRIVGNVSSGALATRGYDRATLELIDRLVWEVLPIELREPTLVGDLVAQTAPDVPARPALVLHGGRN